MNFKTHVQLGRTGLKVGRLGISSSYGAPTAAYEEAFEQGCNYFTWGTFVRGRSKQMKTAIKNIIARGWRDKLVLAVYSYAHSAAVTNITLPKALKALGTDYADVLLLGFYSLKPRKGIIQGALRMKQQGLVKHIGITTHNRKLIPILAAEGEIDIFHVRYNAAHRGAEQDVFPHLPKENRPGMVSFTATCWGQLLNPKKLPPDTKPATAVDCYRFVLSFPNVDIVMSGARTLENLRENLKTLDSGPMSEDELNHMRLIGDYIYGRKKI